MEKDWSEIRRLCVRSVVPSFAEWTWHGQPPPIPEPMKAEIIGEAQNWPLLERFCRERGPLSVNDGKKTAWTFNYLYNSGVRQSQYKQSAIAAALSALLESCPELLRTEECCRVLLRWYLDSGEAAREQLRPCVERLGRRMIAMAWDDWEHWGWEKLPDYWKQAMPDGPILVVDREDYTLCGLMVLNRAPYLADALRKILTSCPVRGKAKKGELSRWALEVLGCGDTALIGSLLQQPGGLLATEDPDALIGYVQCPEWFNCPRASRAAVLAHVRRKVDYEL